MDADGIVKNLETLGKIGFVPEKGTTRMSYTEEYAAGREFVKSLMENVGLKVSIDSVGNLSGLWEGLIKRRLAVGSHIDTVPNGGFYDGTLGVIAAIQSIRELKESGYQNRHSIEVIAFTEEEGNVIGGTFGSKCFTGQKIEPVEYEKMKAYSLDEKSVQESLRKGKDYKCYLEYHIEQGGVLERENRTIGIVKGIVGIIRFRASVKGTANHAGTTPMNLRDDAVLKACSIISDLSSYITKNYGNMVCTIGDIWVPNGAVNVVPGECGFLLELRGASLKPMYRAIEFITAKYETKGFSLEQILEQHETTMDHRMVRLAEVVCNEKQYSYKKMFSGAGHDAMNMALLIPCGMIFIPSIGGISHSLKEYSTPEDIEKGKEVLKEMIVRLDSESGCEDENNNQKWNYCNGV